MRKGTHMKKRPILIGLSVLFLDISLMLAYFTMYLKLN